MISKLEFVDYILVFDEDTPLNVISEIIPNILVKGGDYSVDDIVGKDIVESNNGIVKVLKFESGYSSTKIISKLNESKD